MHLVIAVSHQHIDFFFSTSQSDPNRGWNVITHAGISKLQVQILAAVYIKEFRQIRRNGPGCSHEHITLIHFIIEDSNQVPLANLLSSMLNENLCIFYVFPRIFFEADFVYPVFLRLNPSLNPSSKQGTQR